MPSVNICNFKSTLMVSLVLMTQFLFYVKQRTKLLDKEM